MARSEEIRLKTDLKFMNERCEREKTPSERSIGLVLAAVKTASFQTVASQWK
jgi:hypothetical protein